MFHLPCNAVPVRLPELKWWRLIMAQNSNRILDELAKLMTDAAGAAQGVKREVEGAFRAQGERFLNSMDLVQREEFDAVLAMAQKARAENETLSARIEALEAKLGVSRPAAKPAPKKAAKPAAGKK
jgi:BMFP domain-containing protein YqiC